jgi:hypothetical protein
MSDVVVDRVDGGGGSAGTEATWGKGREREGDDNAAATAGDMRPVNEGLSGTSL